MSYLGIGEKVTENQVAQFAIDTAIVVGVVMVTNHFVIQPGYEKVRSWMKTETEAEKAERLAKELKEAQEKAAEAAKAAGK
jgi:hypothetical protein